MTLRDWIETLFVVLWVLVPPVIVIAFIGS